MKNKYKLVKLTVEIQTKYADILEEVIGDMLDNDILIDYIWDYSSSHPAAKEHELEFDSQVFSSWLEQSEVPLCQDIGFHTDQTWDEQGNLICQACGKQIMSKKDLDWSVSGE